MNTLEPFASHVRIYLRSGNIRVSEQHLYHSQIGTMVEQMSSKCMAKRMGGHGPADACGGSMSFDQMPEGLPSHG